VPLSPSKKTEEQRKTPQEEKAKSKTNQQRETKNGC
jgi:hypothetical protein